MAGKKGMKHRRGRTQEERDKYALARIEQIYDSTVDSIIECPLCRTEHKMEIDSVKAKLLADRYATLRPKLSSSEVKMQVQSMSDVLKEISDRKIAAQHTEEPDQPVVTH